MEKDPVSPEVRRRPEEPLRADRLKAALKANMGRRKAQAKVRAERGEGGAGAADEGAG